MNKERHKHVSRKEKLQQAVIKELRVLHKNWQPTLLVFICNISPTTHLDI